MNETTYSKNRQIAIEKTKKSLAELENLGWKAIMERDFSMAELCRNEIKKGRRFLASLETLYDLNEE